MFLRGVDETRLSQPQYLKSVAKDGIASSELRESLISFNIATDSSQNSEHHHTGNFSSTKLLIE
jgi:hypothetical protein